jgi:hypothetical protein
MTGEPDEDTGACRYRGYRWPACWQVFARFLALPSFHLAYNRRIPQGHYSMKNEQEHPSADDLPLYLRKETRAFLESHIERTYNDLESLNDKARANIGAASLFLSFAAAFQLFVFDTPISNLYLLLLTVALALYAGMIILSLTVFLSVEYYWPVAAEWDAVTSYWEFESEQAYVEQIISEYIEAIARNRQEIDRKARNYRASGVLFGMIIVDLAVMTLVKLAA